MYDTNHIPSASLLITSLRQQLFLPVGNCMLHIPTSWRNWHCQLIFWNMRRISVKIILTNISILQQRNRYIFKRCKPGSNINIIISVQDVSQVVLRYWLLDGCTSSVMLLISMWLLYGGDLLGVSGDVWPEGPLLLEQVISLPSEDCLRWWMASWLPTRVRFSGFLFRYLKNRNWLEFLDCHNK